MDGGSVAFDRYRLEERIGKGGMSVVWRATDLLLDQTVALKRISLAGVDDEQAELTRERALREARLAARLRHHRHVVATYDLRIDDGDVWLVLEYLPSHSLAQILRERGPVDPGWAARIGAQVADALAAAHELGIEHRDVTPGNVIITEDGTAKLTDFGISHLAGDAQLTETGRICGTCAYLAPEVARTGKSSPASDMPRRPVMTAVLALITIAALTGGVILALVGGRDNTSAVGVPTLPSAVGPTPPPTAVVRPEADLPQPTCATCAPGGETFTQQVHTSNPAGTNTFRDPRAFGGQGPRVLPGQKVEVVCRFFDPNATGSVLPGWWYLVASQPWNRQYYTPANSYLNGDPPEGPYKSDVDDRVPVC